MILSYRKSCQRIEFVIKKYSDAKYDDYTKSQIANYTCILLSGFIETAIRDLISGHCENKATQRISNFVRSRLERFQNPDPQNIVTLLNSFDQAIADRLEGVWVGEIKDAIGSIVGNRHLIAHGRDTSLTLSRVSEWFQSSKKFIGFLENEFV